jgi:hypothetical protein
VERIAVNAEASIVKRTIEETLKSTSTAGTLTADAMPSEIGLEFSSIYVIEDALIVVKAIPAF